MKKKKLSSLLVHDEEEQERINKMIAKRKNKLNKLKKRKQEQVGKQPKPSSHRAKIQAQLNQQQQRLNYDPEIDQIDGYYQDKLEEQSDSKNQSRIQFPGNKKLYGEFNVDQKYRGQVVAKDQIFNNKMSVEMSSEEQEDSQFQDESQEDLKRDGDNESDSSASEQYLNLIKNKHFINDNTSQNASLDSQIDGEMENLEEEYHKSIQKMHTISGEQLKKAKCINQQINFHQSLMKFRIINLQKVFKKCNQLPPSQIFKKLSKISHSQKQLQSPIIANLSSVLSELLLLQQQLWSERGDSFNIPHQLLPNLSIKQSQNMWKIIQSQNNSLQPACNEIIQRWNRKDQLSSRKGTQLSRLNKSIPSQVDYLIETNLEKLIKKTQLIEQQQIINYKDFLDPSEVYNDSEFYLQQIKQWGQNINQQGLSEAQLSMSLKSAKRRAQVKVKDVDTKASKGRKLRYHVHQKLVGFMYPKEKFDNQDEGDLGGGNRILSTLFGQKTDEGNVIKKYNKEELKELSKQQKIWEDAQIRFI